MKTLTKELIIRSIKLLDMGYAGAVNILSAIFLVSIINKIEGEYNPLEEEKKSTAKLLLHVILKMWLIVVLAYIVRNVFQMIPFPFEGVCGYKHMKVGEVTSSSIFIAFMVVFDKPLQEKISILKKRIIKM
jgi:hypothetical protein